MKRAAKLNLYYSNYSQQTLIVSVHCYNYMYIGKPLFCACTHRKPLYLCRGLLYVHMIMVHR